MKLPLGRPSSRNLSRSSLPFLGGGYFSSTIDNCGISREDPKRYARSPVTLTLATGGKPSPAGGNSRGFHIWGLAFAAACLFGFFAMSAVYANDVSRALWQIDHRLTNQSTTVIINRAIPISESGAALISGNFMNADALDSHVHRGAAEVPAMPASGYLNLLGAVADDGGVQTDETTAANNATANDITLMAPDVSRAERKRTSGAEQNRTTERHVVKHQGPGGVRARFRQLPEVGWTSCCA